MWANFSSLLRRGSLWEVLNAIASGRVCGERWEEKKDIQHILSFPSPQPPNYQPTVEAARKRSLRRREQFQEEATKLDNYIILRGFHISLNWFSSWSNCLVFAGEGKPEKPEVNPQSKARTHIKFNSRMLPGRNCTALVGGKSSHHSAIPALRIAYWIIIEMQNNENVNCK